MAIALGCLPKLEETGLGGVELVLTWGPSLRIALIVFEGAMKAARGECQPMKPTNGSNDCPGKIYPRVH